MTEAGGIYELHDVERTLGLVVVGYRVVAAGWAVLLVLVAQTAEPGLARRWVPWAEVAAIVAWLAITVWMSGSHPAALRTWWFVGVDLAIAVGVLSASWLAGDANVSLSGGYPLSALAVAVYAKGGAGGLIVGGGLLTAALIRRFGALQVDLATVVSDVASWGFPVVVFSWAAGVIRAFDVRRRRSERALADERAKRARVEERAELAAHLHDSVLQTLALIQRSADQPDEVNTLARRQERELRGWLYGTEPPPAGDTLVGESRSIADAIEAESRIKVDLVSVGDIAMSESVQSLTRAARESVANAARHAGVDSVHVYSEVDPDHVAVFVRDRGSGFDVSAIPADRAGVRESIVGRMERAGGAAVIRSSAGRGTEVALTLPTDPRVEGS